MRKIVEIKDADSCFNKAKDNERMFIILERDITMPEVIRFWVEKRIEKGKNTRDDEQILEALDLADLVEEDNKRKEETAKRVSEEKNA